MAVRDCTTHLGEGLQRALPSATANQIATWLDMGRGGPIMRAATVLETVLAARPREEVMALILADVVLAQSFGWTHVTPLLAVGLKSRDLRKQGKDLQLACHTRWSPRSVRRFRSRLI